MFLKQFYGQRYRHFLTILSITLSIGLLLIVSTVSDNITLSLHQQMEKMGLKTVYLSVLKPEKYTKELQQIKQHAKHFLTYRVKEYQGLDLVGIDESLDQLFVMDYQGRLINPLDAKNNENVVVLGEQAYRHFNCPKIGEIIYLQGIPFNLIGIIQSNQQNVLIDFDRSIYICKDYLKSGDYENYYLLSDEEISHYFLKDDYLLLDQKATSEAFELLIQLINQLLSFLTSFCFFISILGLLNHSLSNLKIRVKEIGLKRTLGANNRKIFEEFLLENLILVLISWSISMVSSILLLYGMDHKIEFDWIMLVKKSVWIIVFALVSGSFCAYKATRITIIDALKQ